MATFPRTLLRNPTTIADILAVVEQVMTDRLRADESARLAEPDVDVDVLDEHLAAQRALLKEALGTMEQ